MLRFRNESISITLCHDRIGGICRKNGLTEDLPVVQYDPAAVGTDSTASIEALSVWLDGQAIKGRHASVVLSNSFVRYALIPWNDASLSSQEEDILFQTKFEELYGDMDGWRILADGAQYGKPRIACAVHQALIDRINELWKTKGINGGEIVPYFVACLNRWHRCLGQHSGMIVIAEMHNVVIGCFGKKKWSSLRGILSKATPKTLSDIAFREGLLQGHSSTIPVWIHYLDPLQNGINPFVAGEKLLVLDSPSQDPCLMMAKVGCFR